jgi:hypothetical protein
VFPAAVAGPEYRRAIVKVLAKMNLINFMGGGRAAKGPSHFQTPWQAFGHHEALRSD